MTRLLLVLCAAALLLPGAAGAAACSPLNCAPSQFTLDHGSLLAYRTSANAPISVTSLVTGEGVATLPAGFVYRDTLIHREGKTIEWYDATTGAKTASKALPWGIRLAGGSQDGSRAVGFRLTPDRATSIVVVSASGARTIVIPGRQWDFDALRGNHLVLIRYLRQGGYRIRLLDLRTGKLAPKPLKDPHESGIIWGQPFERVSSADGRFLFTSYIASNGSAMVHELDLDTATARCIDLPGTGDYGAAASWAMLASPNGRTLWAVAPGYGRAVAIDVASRKVIRSFRITLDYWNLGNGTRAAMSPDGREVALTDGETVARVGLEARKVVQRLKVRAVAVGYSPDGQLRTLP
jgi:DNA-binding beta-propeller fold protein YncE